MEIDREAIIQTFLADSHENLRIMEEALIVLETKPDDTEILQTIFRVAHTFKGDASLLGFERLMEFAHTLESLLEILQDRVIFVTSELITLLLESVDCLRQMISEAIAGIEEMNPLHRAVLKKITDKLSLVVNTEETPITKQAFIEEKVGSDLIIEEIKPITEKTKIIRVNIDKLDKMLTLTSEIAIARGCLTTMLEKTGGLVTKDLLEAHQKADLLYLELQELVMKVRMVHVGPVFRQYIRTVRDLAVMHGKAVRLVIEDGNVEADTTIVDNLRAALTHILRNAVDHGIEIPERRKSQGKDPCGTIVIKAYHEGSNIVVEIIDDGMGINKKQIIEKVRKKGKILEAEELSDNEIYDMLFEPGFSTAEHVTDLSGRGIGMDAVRQNIEAIRGSIEIESKETEGTKIILRLPLTLAIIDGFCIGVGTETYVIPLDSVVECLALAEQEHNQNDDTGVVNLRGEVLPYIRLRNLFSLNGALTTRENLVVVKHGNDRIGLVVETLYGETQIVIKPLGKLFQHLQGISGSAILGNGRVALILDIPAISRHFIKNRHDNN